MKKLVTSIQILSVVIICSCMFQSCLKDSATKTYTLYSPVYRSVAEVRAAIKSDAATPIVKPGKIVVLGNYIFLNEVDKGIHVIDNSNPAAPVNTYFIAIPGNLDLAVKGNILYADLYRDLVALDISNPSVAQVKKITSNVFPARQYNVYFVPDTTRVIVDWTKKDTTVNNDAPPVYPGGVMFFNAPGVALASSSSAPVGVNGSTSRFTLLSNYLYTVSNYNLNAFDVSQPENPVLAGSKNIGWQIETISTFKNNLFIGAQSGMYVFGTTNPAQPNQLYMFTHVTSCDPVIADGNYAYVTLHDGTACHGKINELDVFDLTNLNDLKNVRTYTLTNPHGLAKDGNTLFICDGAAGLKVFNATDPYNITLLQTIGGINAIDIVAFNNNAIVVTTDGLFQYDYTNQKQVTLRSKITYAL